MPTSSDLSDQELIAGCLKETDSAGWEIFVRRYSKLILSCIHRTFRGYSFFHDTEDVGDVYGTFFLSLIDNDFKKLRQFQHRNECRLSTWLAVVAVRQSIDYMRRQHRSRMKSLDEEPALFDTLADTTQNCELLLSDRQELDSLKKALDSLPHQDRAIFDLLYTQNLSPETAARKLGISTAAIYTRKHRLIEKIKKYNEL